MFLNFIFLLIPFIVPLIVFIHNISAKIIKNYENQKEKKEKEVNFTRDENISWECHLEHDHPEILPCFTFEQIKTFYYTAPEKWKRFPYSICYYKDDYNRVAIHTPAKEDYVLALRFFDEQEKKKEKQKQIEATLGLLPYLKEDAARAQREAEDMLCKCEQDIQNIAKNLEREKRVALENSTLT